MPIVHLHRFNALHLTCSGDRAALFFDRVVVFGWLWLMCCACLLIAICVDGGGVAVVVQVVHLHSFSALHFKCVVGRVGFF